MDIPPSRAAFDRVVLPCLDSLTGAAVRLTGSRADADDLVQETVLRAWAFWDRFEPGTNARAWLHRILVNSFINGYRRRRRERDVLAEVQRVSERTSSAAREGSAARDAGVSDEVAEALAALPDEFRSVVVLVDGGGKSYREAADRLGCPIGTVMSRLHRARRLLKERLRGYAAQEGYLAAA